MTSSTKPKVYNIFQAVLPENDPTTVTDVIHRPFSEVAARQTDRQTDILIAVLYTHPGGRCVK